MHHRSTTKRFILRPFEITDLDDFLELESDPEVHTFLGNNPVTTKKQLSNIIQGVFDQYQRNGIGRWAIEAKDSGEVVGWSGLKWEEEVRETPYYDVGYRIKRKHWGKGIATEVGLESLRYGFQEMNLSSIGGGAEIDHAVSNHILKKIGLVHNDTIMAFGKLHHWYEVDREDWLKWNEL